MADKQTGGRPSGTGPRRDPTTMPGQYPSKLAFGIAVPQSTGAPGTEGAAPSPDATVHTPTPESNFGAPFDDLHTGAPGSMGASAHVSGGAFYTDPFGYLAGGGAGASSNGSTDTEAQGNKYGYPAPGGAATPMSTGAGEGSPMIGGRTRIRRDGD